MDRTGLVLAAVVFAVYGFLVTGWLRLRRRFGLAGPGAPRAAVLPRGEARARRALEALLFLDALVVVPALLLAVPLALRSSDASFWMAVIIAAAILFLAPVPRLRRTVQTLETLRHMGIPEAAVRPSTGHAGLDELLRRPIPATHLTAALIVAVSVAAWIVPDLELLLRKSTPEIRAGQLWRLATVALVHGGGLHLFFNVSVFVDVGGLMERLQGARRVLAEFWLGTVAGTLASMALFPGVPSVGASGGVFALLGALLTVAVRHGRDLPPAVRARLVRSTAVAIGANVILGFALPHVDWAAHLGGLAAGAALGWGLGLASGARTALRAPAPR